MQRSGDYKQNMSKRMEPLQQFGRAILSNIENARVSLMRKSTREKQEECSNYVLKMAKEVLRGSPASITYRFSEVIVRMYVEYSEKLPRNF